jgi:hypothetical protein
MYIDLSLDQFNDGNKDYYNISFGKKGSIKSVNILINKKDVFSRYERISKLPI